MNAHARAAERLVRDDARLHWHDAAVWQVRDDRYSEIRTEATSKERKVEMSYIGG